MHHVAPRVCTLTAPQVAAHPAQLPTGTTRNQQTLSPRAFEVDRPGGDGWLPPPLTH